MSLRAGPSRAVSPFLAALFGALSFVAASPSTAWAQEPLPDAAPSPAPVAAPSPAEAPPADGPPAGDARRDERRDDVRFTDTHADRVILGSTGETHPQGTFFVSDYEILLVQLGYAVTDDLQLSVSGIPPIAKDQPYFFDFGLKLNVARTESFRAALTGALDAITSAGSGEGHTYYGGRAGAVGQFCFEHTCRSSVSLNVGTVLSSGSSRLLPIYGSVGFIANVSPLVSLLAEPSVLGVTGTGDSNVQGGALFAVSYGVRLAQKNFGVDLTFIEPVMNTNDSSSNPFILGYPFVAFTYRTDGNARQ